MAIARFKISCDEYELAYDLVQENSKQNMLIMHGWGANKELMQLKFKNKFKSYNKLFIDLPGFGKSSISKAINSYEYTKIVEFFLNHINFKPNLVLGHSFGGKIAANLGLYDKNLKLVLLSSAGILLPKPFNVKAKIRLFKLLKPLKLANLQKYFLSDDAKDLSPVLQATFKLVVDEDYEEIFLKLCNKTLLCWGEADSATPLKSAKIMASLIKNSKLFVCQGDHFFFLQQASLIEQKVYEYFGE